MSKASTRTTTRNHKRPKLNPGLPDLESSKMAVLRSLRAPASRRGYKHAMEEFIGWYCSEPHLALNKTVVLRYRFYLEERGLAAGTINVRMAAVRRLSYEAADSGLLSPELAAGIHRVKGARKQGVRLGNWLTAAEACALWQAPDGNTLKGKRDRSMLALLLGCGFRRRELAELTVEHLQRREDRWTVVDLVGKGGRIRTVPIPSWVKAELDSWLVSASIVHGPLFRCVCRSGSLWSRGISEKAVWHVVKQAAAQMNLHRVAPHDLRRSCARLCHDAGGELEQIQFLLVNDKLGIEPG